MTRSKNDKKPDAWLPEVTYPSEDEDAEDGGQLGNLPMIHVPPGEKMPRFLIIWEARDTGQIEPGPSGEDLPVVEWELRQYAQMDVLKAGLKPEQYDAVRVALGLKPMAEAVPAGRAITERIRNNVAHRATIDGITNKDN